MIISSDQIFQVMDHDVEEFWRYCWNCYGKFAYGVDFNCQSKNEVSFIHNPITREVFEITAYDFHNDRAYRWIHPDYVESHIAESEEIGADPHDSYIGGTFIDIDVKQDILDRMIAIADGDDYDTRVTIPIDISDEDLLKLMKQAHELDMTFNNYVEMVIENMLGEKHENKLSDYL